MDNIYIITKNNVICYASLNLFSKFAEPLVYSQLCKVLVFTNHNYYSFIITKK